jgi:hypothetical protein
VIQLSQIVVVVVVVVVVFLTPIQVPDPLDMVFKKSLRWRWHGCKACP